MVLTGWAAGVPTNGAAQHDSAWAERSLMAFDMLEGSWTGAIDGTIGSSAARREYRFVLHGRFLHMMHDRDPQAPAEPGNAPEEWGIFSHDPERDLIVLREFLVEGLVNRYVCRTASEPLGLTCRSEASEGGSGLNLSLQYVFTDRDRFTETFEVVGSDGEAQMRIRGEWVRAGGGR